MVEVRVPGADEFVAILRGVVGRLARLAGMSYNGIEDLALAVDEASVLLLETVPAEIVMAVDVEAGGDLVVHLSVVAQSRRWPPPGLESTTRWEIMGAICERVWLLADGNGIGLGQSIR